MFATALLSSVVWSAGMAVQQSPNGYLDYLAAADRISGSEYAVYDALAGKLGPGYQDDSPAEIQSLAKRLNELPPLEIRREMVKRFGRILDLVSTGNGKPVYNPQSLTVDLLFPEYTKFRVVGRFMGYAAEVAAADGRTDRAVKILADELTFTDNFARGILISDLMGISTRAQVFLTAESLFPRLTPADLSTLERAANDLLSRTPAAIETITNEFKMYDRTLGDLAQLPETELKGGPVRSDDDDPDWRRFAPEWNRLTPAARRNVFVSARERSAERGRRLIQALGRSDSGWIRLADELETSDEAPPLDLADYFASIVKPVFDTYLRACVRGRVQLRLLALYSAAWRSRWEHGRFPDRIDVSDPATGKPYLYEKLSGGRIRIASIGFHNFGEIDLVYRRAKKDDGEVQP